MTTFWMQTHSGERPFPFAVKPEEIYIEDIAHALSNICRFGGHTSKFYSVAQHSLAASLAAYAQGFNASTQLACLLHDAAEAYLGDVIRPIKRHPSMETFCAAERVVMRAVWERFGLAPDRPMLDTISELDEELIAVEARILCNADSSWKLNLSDWSPETAAAFHTVSTHTPAEAKSAFLFVYSTLTSDKTLWATQRTQSPYETLSLALSLYRGVNPAHGPSPQDQPTDGPTESEKLSP